MLKIQGALILCIVAVLPKTCLEKFTPKVRRTSYNFTSGKKLSFVISRKLLDVLKIFFFLLEVRLMYIYILRKSQFQSFDPFRYGNANGKLKALFTRHKLTQVVCSRHFSKLIRVEPGLVVFT